jgi:hypothetical protein
MPIMRGISISISSRAATAEPFASEAGMPHFRRSRERRR